MNLAAHRHVSVAVEWISGCRQPPATLDLQHLTYGATVAKGLKNSLKVVRDIYPFVGTFGSRKTLQLDVT